MTINEQYIATMSNMLNQTYQILLDISMQQKNYIYSFIEQDMEIKMYLPYMHDYIQNYIVRTHSFFEIQILRFMSKFIDPNKTILDIGANIGNHTIYFSKILKCSKIVAFEPQHTMQDIFEKNMVLNEIANVQLNRFPLSDETHKMHIDKFDQNNFGSTMFKISNDGAYESKPLDSLNIDNIGFIKMDVEEHELNVLKGAKHTLISQHPILWIEIHHNNPTKNETLALLDSYKYKCIAKISDMDFLFKPI